MLIKRIQFLFFAVLLFCSPLVCNAGVTRAEAEATIVEHTVKAAEDALATLQSINNRRSADMKALQYYGEIWGMNLYLYNSFNPDVNKAATRKLTEEIFPAIKKARQRIFDADYYGSQLLENAVDLEVVVATLYEQRAEKFPDEKLVKRAKSVARRAVPVLEVEYYTAFEALTRPDEIKELTEDQRKNCAEYLMRMYFDHYSVKSACSMIGLKKGNIFESVTDKKNFNQLLSKIRKNVKGLSELDFFGIALYKGIVEKIVEQDVDGADEE